MMTFSVSYAKAPQYLLSKDGFSGVKIGMSKQALDEGHPHLKYSDEVTPGCLEVEDDAGVTIMIEEGYVTRVQVNEPHYLTDKNIHVGSTEQEVVAAYGKAALKENAKYDENGHFFFVIDAQSKKGISFETDGKKVTSMYAGKLPSLQYVEGCL
ncbi:MAG: hypothetical protein B7X02_01240 [Rhodospirillales bacterium 12-54-5]|nr:MAG: hypothetical protein B7X02_01240 [Rhodospirillales bacterium 12-54-5]